MIAFLMIPIALAFPTLEGVLLLRFIERKERVLSHLERWCAGFLLGLSFSSFLLFFAVFVGLPLVLQGFLIFHSVLLASLLLFVRSILKENLWRIFFPPDAPSLSLSFSQIPRSVKILGVLVLLWVTFKIAVGAYDLFLTPSYFNDTYANWNARAKAFFTSESLLLDLPSVHRFYFGGRVPSYPLTIYFTKVWLAMMNGGWSEIVVNSVHLLWFFALLGFLFASITRLIGASYGVLSLIVLVSIPLFFLQGVNAYTDVIMSAYLFLPLLFFYQWMLEKSGERRDVWLWLLSVSAAAMVFVKSEALLIFLPPLTLLFGIASFRQMRSLSPWGRVMGIYLGVVMLIALPWTIFKIAHGLEFGNAQSVSGFVLSPNPGVPLAIFNDLFYTGSFLLFFPIFLLLLSLSFTFWTKHPVRILLGFLGIVLLGQFFIYYLTPLANEAIQHTGYGRGVLHLFPTLTFVAMLLLQSIIATSIEERSSVLPSLPSKS